MSTVAAIDCGTNSTRLLIMGGGRRELCREQRITRLGRAVDSTRQLGAEAIERTLSALGEFRSLVDGHGVEKVRAVATSAARDAENRDAFFVPAEHVLGVPLELLSGDEEGRLSFSGATQGLDLTPQRVCVIDVGGGSTEFTLAGPSCSLRTVSVDTGSVRLTEQFLLSDPVSPDELDRAMAHVRSLVVDVDRRLQVTSAPTNLVGTAGTVTTLAALDLRLDHYDPFRTHHHILERVAAERLLKTLALQTVEERLKSPMLPAGRADVIVGGAIVVVVVLVAFGLSRCLVSETDILDGIALSLLTEP